ncbi:MAG: hypothetical protein U0V02_14540 [Anaerolineales bacterium]
MKNQKAILGFSILLILIFIGAQFVFRVFTASGGWCAPYLGAPKELGHPAFQFTNYGFPFPFVTVVKDTCAENGKTTYEWSLMGAGIELLLLAMIAYPIWSPPLKRMRQNKSPQ